MEEFPQLYLAHAFGQSFVLPLPAWMYIFGGGLAVIVSFVVVAYFMGQRPVKQRKLEPDNWRVEFKNPALGLVGGLLTAVLIASALTGSSVASRNFGLTLFWIIFFLGFTYLVAVAGNVWPYISPARLIARPFADETPYLDYPKRLGYLPAIFGYFLLVFLELSGIGASPLMLGLLALAYLISTLVGVILVGTKVWLKYCDLFELFFRMVGRLSLLSRAKHVIADHSTLIFFIIFMLASTVVDGFRATTVWASVNHQIHTALGLHGRDAEADFMVLIACMLAGWLILSAAYFLAIGAMRALAKTSLSIPRLALIFAYSLIPIAVAYNFAHYFGLLAIQGQAAIAGISDPFNLGWNLFGTADAGVNLAVISGSTIWYLQLASIVLGHIAGVYAAHKRALQVFDRRTAITSQLPMVALMVSYTMLGLWIISQPLAVGK